MTTDFRFITDTAQGHSYKLAIGGASDGLAQGSFPYPRGAHEAQDGAFDLIDPLLNREILKDPLLHLV